MGNCFIFCYIYYGRLIAASIKAGHLYTVSVFGQTQGIFINTKQYKQNAIPG